MTNPPIDPTLTISNAAADAKVTGDKITDLKNALNSINENIKNGVYYEETQEDIAYASGYYDNNGIYHANGANYFYESECFECYDTEYVILNKYPSGSGFETITFFASPFCRANERISGIVAPTSGLIPVPSNALGFKVGAQINNPERYTEVTKIRKAYNHKRNYIFVSKSMGISDATGTPEKPYTNIYDANESITDNNSKNQYFIMVDGGTYTDLQEKYSGDTSTTGLQGVICKDYVNYYSYNQLKVPGKNALSTITWDGATGLNPSDVTVATTGLKCPFHIPNNVHTAIKGFKIYGKNLRYGMHIETTGTNGFSEWLIENCEIVYYGNPDTVDWTTGWVKPVIGCGTTYGEKGLIKNCVLQNNDEGNENNPWIMQTHDNADNPLLLGMRIGAEYVLENCLFKVKGTSSSTFSMRSGNTTYDIPNNLKIKRCVDTSHRKKVYFTQAQGEAWTVDFESTTGEIA